MDAAYKVHTTLGPGFLEYLLPVHKKELLTYIRLANKRLGLLLNFGANRIKEGISRLVNDLPE